MEVLGNSVLGKIFRGSGLLLNNDGLYRFIKVKKGSNNFDTYKLFLTNDVNKICELLEMTPEDFNTDDDIVFAKLATSPYVNLDHFNGLEDVDAYHIANFSKWIVSQKLNGIEFPEHGRKTIRTVKVQEVLGFEYSNTVDRIKYLLSNGASIYKSKFEAMKKELINVDYNFKNFQTDLDNFFANLGGDKIQKYAYFDRKTPKELAIRILTGTEIEIA